MCHLDNSTRLTFCEPGVSVICLWSTSFAHYFMRSFTIKTNQEPEQHFPQRTKHKIISDKNYFFKKNQHYFFHTMHSRSVSNIPTPEMILPWVASHSFDGNYLPCGKAEAFSHYWTIDLVEVWSMTSPTRGQMNRRCQIARGFAVSSRMKVPR